MGATLPFMLYIMALSALLTLVRGTCSDIQLTCINKAKFSGSATDICRAGRSAIDCVNTRLKNNTACTQQTKTLLQSNVDKVKHELVRQGCAGVSGLMSSLALCLGLSVVTYFLISYK